MNQITRQILRWVARVWAALMAALILFIFIGDAVTDGVGPMFQLDAREMLLMAAFLTVFVGLILAWKWERLGGWLIVGGMAAFYFLDFAFSGSFPRGATFFMIALPGILYLILNYSKKQVN
jgi:hypothetical protein